MKQILFRFSKKLRGQFQNPQHLASLVSILMIFSLSIHAKTIVTGLLFTKFNDPRQYQAFWSNVLTQISALMSSLIVWITLGINIRNSTESNYRSGVSYIKDLISRVEDLSKNIFTTTSKPFLDFMAMFYYLLGDADNFVKQRNIDPTLFESFIEARFHNIHLFENLMSQIESILTCDSEKHHKTTNLEENKIPGGIYLSNYASSIEASMPKEFVFSILVLSLLNRYDLHMLDVSKNKNYPWKISMLEILHRKKNSPIHTEWDNISRVQRNFIDLVCPFFSIEFLLKSPDEIEIVSILEHIEKALCEDRVLHSLQNTSFYEIPINMVYNVASKVSILKKNHFEESFISSYGDFLLRLTHSCLLRYIEVIGTENIKKSFSSKNKSNIDCNESVHGVLFFILKDLVCSETTITNANFKDKKHSLFPWEEFIFLKDINIAPDDESSIDFYTNYYKHYVWNVTASKILAKFPTLKSFLLQKHRFLKKQNLYPYLKK